VFLKHHGYAVRIMTELAPIHALLKAKEQEIEALDRNRDLLVLQAESFRDALRAMGDTSIPPKAEKRTVHSPSPPKKKADSRAGTRLGPKWRTAFAKLAERDGEFDYDEVVAAAGGDIEKSLARTKMSDFRNRGLVASKRQGFFFLTEQGKQIAREAKEADPKPATPAATQTAPPSAGVVATPAAVAPAAASQIVAEPQRAATQGIGAPGVPPPSAPIAAQAAAQPAAPVSGISNPSPATGA